MCGRLSLGVSWAELAAFYRLGTAPGFSLPRPPFPRGESPRVAQQVVRDSERPRYDVRPTQPVVVIRRADSGERELAVTRWGLIPSWADDPKIGHRMINARAETVAEKPAFRAAFRRRRCVIVAEGFYEWRKDGNKRLPHFFSRADAAPLLLAGLWERWQPKEGTAVESCAIITTAANRLLSAIHDRMPVVVEQEALDRWLGDERTARETLEALLVPAPESTLTVFAVAAVRDDLKPRPMTEAGGALF